MSLDAAKLRAAEAAVREVEGCEVIGVGTGTTVAKFIEVLASRREFRDRLYVPSSVDTALRLARAGLRVLDPGFAPKVEVYVDGADEVDPQLNMIKGGGAAMTMEKVLAFYAKRRVFIVDYTKLVRKLGEKRPVPIEVLPRALEAVLSKLREWGFEAEPRPAKGKIGPVITDVGGIVVDVRTGPIDDPKTLDAQLRSLPGVVETGLFVGFADAVYVGWPDRCERLEPRG